MKTEHDRRPQSMDIRLDALSATEWRVCDRRASETDHMSILGFVELRNGHFEVMRMSAPRDLVVVDSLDDAKEFFAAFDAGRVHTGKLVV